MVLLEMKKLSLIKFRYVNWQGNTSDRAVEVRHIYYGFTEYHQTNQWLMEAWDFDKDAIRIFAMKDMTNIVKWE